MSAQAPEWNLRDALEQLDRSRAHLEDSFQACLQLAGRTECSRSELVEVEALAIRFSRTSDILIQRVFRALDAYDLYESGTPLDVINRADKRELFDDVESIKRIRALRNTIAHEYELEDIVRLMNEILLLTPDLLEACKRSIAYARELIES